MAVQTIRFRGQALWACLIDVSTMAMTFSTEDLQQLQARGMTPGQVEQQLNKLRVGQVWQRLERPCVIGDGILRIDPDRQATLQKRFDLASQARRLMRFIPASGAATRMFKPLHASPEAYSACRNSPPSASASPSELALRRFLDDLPRFAFYDDLDAAMAEDGRSLSHAVNERDLAEIVRYLLEPCGLGYASLPKALLAFHREVDGARTPFVEHQAEAALLSGSEGQAALHFTVSSEHLPLFEAQAAAWQKCLAETYGCHIELSYSVQKPSTDMPALAEDGEVLRDVEGRLVLRPGGHGALIENLNDLHADIVLVRNIDNVVPDYRKNTNLETTRLLTGLLLELQDEQHGLLRELHNHKDDPLLRDLGFAFLCDRLQQQVSLEATGEELIALLDRPMRVCGMVPASGEPGGGPFWVRGADGGLTRQIVEGAQINASDPEQAEVLAGSTHFNPVDMVCAVRDWRGQPYDLRQYVDHSAAIVTSKVQDGEKIRVIELPGLWNGSMARWHTLFVEIPAEAFNPVKTVLDLLRPAHQP